MFANPDTFACPDPSSSAMRKDPRPSLLERGGHRSLHNLHAYVANDPVNLTDPLGLGPQNDDEPITVTGHRVGGGGAGGVGGGSRAMSGGPTISDNEATPAVPLPGPPLPGRPAVCLGEDAEGGCAEIVVTARFRADAPFAFDGQRFVLNPYYLKPWYSDYADACVVVCGPLIGLAAAGAPVAATGIAGRMAMSRTFGFASSRFGNTFYRGGSPGSWNRGPVRLGWSYNQRADMMTFQPRIGGYHVPSPLQTPPF